MEDSKEKSVLTNKDKIGYEKEIMLRTYREFFTHWANLEAASDDSSMNLNFCVEFWIHC